MLASVSPPLGRFSRLLFHSLEPAALLQNAPSIVRSNNACDVSPFSHAHPRPPQYRISIPFTRQCIALQSQTQRWLHVVISDLLRVPRFKRRTPRRRWTPDNSAVETYESFGQSRERVLPSAEETRGVFRRRVFGGSVNVACADITSRSLVSSRPLRIDYVRSECECMQCVAWKKAWNFRSFVAGGPEGLIYASCLLVSLLRARVGDRRSVDSRKFWLWE